MTDAELDAQADAGEFYLDEEGQQMLNDALWRLMNEEIRTRTLRSGNTKADVNSIN
jgi:hypothetical protein